MILAVVCEMLSGGDGVGFWLPVGAERGSVPLSAEVKLLGFNICCKV